MSEVARPHGFEALQNEAYLANVPPKGEQRLYPGPILDTETDVRARPSGSLVFSIHPAGALQLYHRAWSLADTSVRSKLDSDWWPVLERHLWLLVSTSFEPGTTLREGFERLIKACEGSSRGTSYSPTEREYLGQRLRLLAAHFVAEALRETA